MPLTQVLKAHCLERTGRQDEALELCREVEVERLSHYPSSSYLELITMIISVARIQRNKPTDESVLSTLCLVYKWTGNRSQTVKVYENAIAVQPSNIFPSHGVSPPPQP